jgi:hypothetical protein
MVTACLESCFVECRASEVSPSRLESRHRHSRARALSRLTLHPIVVRMGPGSRACRRCTQRSFPPFPLAGPHLKGQARRIRCPRLPSLQVRGRGRRSRGKRRPRRGSRIRRLEGIQRSPGRQSLTGGRASSSKASVESRWRRQVQWSVRGLGVVQRTVRGGGRDLQLAAEEVGGRTQA